MLLRSCWKYALVILWLAPPVFAQSSSLVGSQDNSDPAAVSTLDRSLAAMGAASVGPRTSMRASVVVTDNQGNVSNGMITTLGSSNLRIDGANSIVVSNGVAASIQSGSDSPSAIPQAALSEIGFTHIPVLSALREWQALGIRLQYVGEEKLGAIDAVHLHYLQPIDSELGTNGFSGLCDIYIDLRTYFIVRLTYVVRSSGDLSRGMVLTADYSDYRPVSGVMIPFGVTYLLNENVISSQHISEIQANVPVTDSLFLIQ
jgi:hypothetical protein